MFKKSLVIAAVIAMSSISSYATTWVGGSSNFWSDSENWSPNDVPGNTVAGVTINISDFTIALTDSNTIDSLNCSGDFILSGAGWGELIIVGGGGLTNNGKLGINRVDITGNINNLLGARCDFDDMEITGNLNNNSGAEYNLANMTINGSIDNDVNAVLFAEGLIDFSRKFVPGGANIDNAGMIFFWEANVDMSGEGTINNTGQINLHNAGYKSTSIINQITGVIRGFGNIGTDNGVDLFQNDGLISASGGTLYLFTENNALVNNGTLRSEPSCFLHVKPMFSEPNQTNVNNNGTIEVQPGGGITFYSNLINDPSGKIDLFGGTLAAVNITQKPSATFRGLGNIAGNVIIDSGGIIEFTGPTTILGDVTVNSGATLKVSDGTTLVLGHTTNSGTIHMQGGRLIPQGGLTDTGTIIQEVGVYNSVADFNLDGEINLADFAGFSEKWLWQSAF